MILHHLFTTPHISLFFPIIICCIFFAHIVSEFDKPRMASKLIQTIVGRNILVTGASSGLGEATARYLALQGAKVTVVDLNV